MALSDIASFWLIAAALIAVPGPDWAFAINAGLRHRVLASAAGITLGYVVLTIITASGIGLVIASAPTALTALTLAGSGYLIWLGIGIVRRPALIDVPDEESGRATTVRQGATVSGLNPKALLIFVALLPQFSNPNQGWPLPFQLAVLGLTFALTCGITYLGVGSAARLLVYVRPAVPRLISRLSGVAMILLAGFLLYDQLA